MRFIIVRHGDPDYSIDSLTSKGWKEAELLSDRLVKLDVKNFYCSPLGRAKDTAKATLKKLNRKAKTLDWAREFEGKVKINGFPIVEIGLTGENRNSHLGAKQISLTCARLTWVTKRWKEDIHCGFTRIWRIAILGFIWTERFWVCGSSIRCGR